MIYLDNAATTLQKPNEVKKAMLDAFGFCANAGRGGYKAAMSASDCVYLARERAMDLFGADSPDKIVFTHNATHSLNIAIKGIGMSGHCVISGYEHNSVLRPIVSMMKNGVSYSVANGRLFDCEDMVKKYRALIKRNTKFAVCTHVSNVFGYILPVSEIDQVCYQKGIPLIIDASQSAGSVEVKLSELKATVCICAPGHKGLYGPQGTGILVCKSGERLKTLIEGGTGSVSAEYVQPDFMPDRHEAGTQNIIGIAGLSEGIAYVQKRGQKKILQHERSLVDYISKELSKMEAVNVFTAHEKFVQSGVLSFVVKNCSCEEVAEKLANKNVAVRSGMQCAPLAHLTVGTGNGTIRVSVSDFTTQKDAEGFLAELFEIVRE